MVGTLVVDGVLDITVIKTLNLPYLRPNTRTFIEVMLIAIIQQTQSSTDFKETSKSKNKAALISIFSKAKENPDLAAGLQYFIKTYVARSDIVASVKEKKALKRSCEIIGEILSVFVVETNSVIADGDGFSD
ncbi:MAG: hypothetical protein Q9157_009227 [Trypethelium eluteriae]